MKIRNNPTRRFLPRGRLGGGLALFAAIAILFVFQLVSRSATLGKASLASPQPLTTPDRLLSQSLSEKETLAARFATSQAEGERAPAPRIAIQAAPNLPPVENPDFRAGILTGEPGPFQSDQIIVENMYQVRTVEGFIQIYAGALGPDQDQGVVVVLTTRPDRIRSSETWVLTPTRSGPVQISSVEGEILVLDSALGVRLTFDWRKGQFIESP